MDQPAQGQHSHNFVVNPLRVVNTEQVTASAAVASPRHSLLRCCMEGFSKASDCMWLCSEIPSGINNDPCTVRCHPFRRRKE